MKKMALWALVLFLVSCSNGRRNNDEVEYGDTVTITKTIKKMISEEDKVQLAKSVGIDTILFVDFANVLHSDAYCKGIARYKKAKPLRPVRLLELGGDDTSEICSRCINSEAMWALDEIVQGYTEKEVEIK